MAGVALGAITDDAEMSRDGLADLDTAFAQLGQLADALRSLDVE